MTSERRYVDEAVPSVRRGVSADSLADVPDTTGTVTTGTGTSNVPYAGTGIGSGSLQYHRPPLGVTLTVAPQSLGIGAEVRQTGSGRAFIPATLTFPEQSVTPAPDHRRIARPLATGERGQSVIGAE